MPPQVLKQQVRNLAASQDLQSLRDGAALQAFGNRLPVLQAFQEFLEIERRRARRRLAAMAFTFLALILGILAIGGVLFASFAGRMNRDVRKLEQALTAARDESGALRGDAQAMQRALDEAKEALASLQQRFDAAAPHDESMDLTGLAAALDVLQELQRAGAEVPSLTARLDSLQREFDRLTSDRARLLQRQARIATGQAELSQAVADVDARQRKVEDDLREIAAFAKASVNDPVSRGGANKKADASVQTNPRVPVPLRVVAVLDELNQLRFEQQGLASRRSELENEALALEQDRQSFAQREAELRSSGAALIEGAQNLLAQQQVLETRIGEMRVQ